MATAPKKIAVIEWDGKPITKPGIYSGMPIMDYHRGDICDGPSISGSGLKTIINESPAHFWSKSALNPKRAPEETSKFMLMGQAAHHLLLGERWFSKMFIVRPDELADPKTGEVRPWNGNRTVCREWIARHEKKGLAILNQEQIEQIKGMAMSLGSHPLVRGGILRGLIEHSLFWKDKETGFWLKARPDAIPTDSGDFANLKTTTSVQWGDLMRNISDYAYHQSAALERDAARIVLGLEMHSYALIFVEREDPWCTRVTQIKPDDIDLGAKQNRQALRIFAQCMKDGRWPGPGGDHDDAAFIDLTDFYRTRAKDQLERISREGRS